MSLIRVGVKLFSSGGSSGAGLKSSDKGLCHILRLSVDPGLDLKNPEIDLTTYVFLLFRKKVHIRDQV